MNRWLWERPATGGHSDGIDDTAHHLPVINRRNAMRQWEMGRQTVHLDIAQEKQFAHNGLLFLKVSIEPATDPQ